MYNLASTADAYLSPALEYMTIKFGFSDSLAGVTLLAFGNGAPDVFSSISAGSDTDSDGILTATKSISILIGGTFFISSCVVAMSTYASNLNEDKSQPPLRMIKVTPRFFIRDIMFYLITCVYLLCIMLFAQHFNLYTAVLLLILYAVYVIIVVVQSKNLTKDEDELL